MTYQPPLDQQTIKNLKQLVRLSSEDPDYFNKSDYSSEVESIVRAMSGKARGQREESEVEMDGTPLDILAELEHTYKTLKDPGHFSQLTGSEKLQVLKTRATLLEKLVDNMERAKNQKQISEFYSAVLEFVEAELSSDQRNRFSEKLKVFAND